MTERKPHSDNDLIDDLQSQGGMSGQGGRAGGQLQRDVGTRAELNSATGGAGRERPTAQDHEAEQNEAKGQETLHKLDPGATDN